MFFNLLIAIVCIIVPLILAVKYTEAGDKAFEYLLTNYRGVFSTFFLLPLSAVFDLFYYARFKITFWLRSAPNAHDEKVKKIQAEIEEWKQEGRTVRMCTARPGWHTMSMRVGNYKKTMKNIHVNYLCDVLNVDTKRQVVRVEPLVTMGQITAALNPLGWTLAVVPELDDLTVGGLICGFGVETSSHKYGLFQYICESFEIILADGSLVKCTKDQNPELFYNIPWSHGTLGFLVAAEIKIIPSKKYVKLTYTPLRNSKDLVNEFEKASRNNDNDFVECLAYSRDTGVLMTGKLTDEMENDKYNPIGNYYKPWFYTHVVKFLEPHVKKPQVEYIPLRHYYHRHTRSLFWMIADVIPFGNNPIFRLLMGWAVPPKVSLLKLTETKTTKRLYEKHSVVQDMLVPIKTLDESLTLFHKEFQVYPLWLCPMRVYATHDPKKYSGFLKPVPGDDLFVDIGAYGIVTKVKNYDAKAALRTCEAFVRKVKGYQALYADTLMTREEFRQMFDHTAYDKLRQKYECDKAFPEVYDKISKAARS